MLSSIALLLLLPSGFAQSTGGIPMPKPPALPVIAEKNLPGEKWASGPRPITEEIQIYDSWKSTRHAIATLRPGSSVVLIDGVSEVLQPDRIEITAPIPPLHLNRGDIIFRYRDTGEGYADFWIKGRWYVELDGSFIVNADESGCGGQRCAARELAPGRKNWWLKVQLPDGRAGWTQNRGIRGY